MPGREQRYECLYVEFLVGQWRIGIVRNPVVRLAFVCLFGQCHRQGRAIVELAAHLVDVPVAHGKGCVEHTDVRAVSFHFLHVPQRESVVVAVCHYYAVFADAGQVVAADGTCR